MGARPPALLRLLPSLSLCLTLGLCAPSAVGAELARVLLAEALSGGVPGRDRPQAAALFGVPFAPGELAADSALHLVDDDGAAVYGSASPLARWPDGTVRWLRVSAQTDVAAGGASSLHLRRGRGPDFGSMLVRDGERFVVDTGAAVFTLDNASLSGPGLRASEVYAIDGQGRRYRSQPGDGQPLLAVELDTPALAELRAIGTLSGPGGAHFDYTVRYRFSRGHSTVISRVAFRNAALYRRGGLAFRELGLRLIPTTAASDYRWNGGAGTIPAALYQGLPQSLPLQGRYRQRWPLNCNAAEQLAPGTCARGDNGRRWRPDPAYRGVRVRRGNAPPPGEASPTPALEWLQHGALAASIELMPATPGGGFNVRADALDLQFYAGPATHTQPWGSHRSYRAGFDPTGRDPQALYYDVAWPVAGRASFQRYRDSGAFFGETALLDGPRQDDFWRALSGARPAAADRPESNLPLQRILSVHWRRNYVEPYTYLLDYAREGRGGRLQRALEFVRYVGDAAIVRSDGFDFSAQLDVAPGGVNLLDGGHATTAVIPLAAWFTAEPWLAELARDHAESEQGLIERGRFDINRTWHNYRSTLRRYRNTALAYDYLAASAHPDAERFLPLQALRRLVYTVLPEPAAGADPSEAERCDLHALQGRSLRRGYLYLANRIRAERCDRVKHAFFGPHLSGDTFPVMRDVLQRWAGAEPQRLGLLEDFDELLLGQAQHTVYEALVADPQRGLRAYPNDYRLDRANPDLGSPWYAYLFSWHATHVWDQTGDPAGLWDAARTLRRKIDLSGEWMPAKLQNQRLMSIVAGRLLAGKSVDELKAMRDRPGESPWQRLPAALSDDDLNRLAGRWRERPPPQPEGLWRTLQLEIVESAPDRYLLRWQPPAGARELRIKWSYRPLVDWLGFDQLSRSYRYPPERYTPWFGALNLRGEPPPAAGAMRIDSAAGAPVHFAARYR